MNNRDLHGISQNLSDLLRIRLENKETCADVIETYESLTCLTWDFVSRFVGPRGTKALMERSTTLAGLHAHLVLKLQIGDEGVDFDGLRAFVEQAGCDRAELVNALLRLSVRIFWTLDELAGDALHGPLLRHLKKDDHRENSISGCCDSNGRNGK